VFFLPYFGKDNSHHKKLKENKRREKKKPKLRKAEPTKK
jgi:hypothetical protein